MNFAQKNLNQWQNNTQVSELSHETVPVIVEALQVVPINILVGVLVVSVILIVVLAIRMSRE